MAHDKSRPLTPAQLEAFRAQLRGEVLDPSSPSYDAVRVVWNGMIDRRPALIARCRNAADVAASINFACDHGLAIAVRSGGHNVAGYAVCDGGLMVDLSLMNGACSPGLDRAIVETAPHGAMLMRRPRRSTAHSGWVDLGNGRGGLTYRKLASCAGAGRLR
jgi:hypothetical protein